MMTAAEVDHLIREAADAIERNVAGKDQEGVNELVGADGLQERRQAGAPADAFRGLMPGALRAMEALAPAAQRAAVAAGDAHRALVAARRRAMLNLIRFRLAVRRAARFVARVARGAHDRGHRPRGRTARRRAASTTRDDGAGDPDPEPAPWGCSSRTLIGGAV